MTQRMKEISAPSQDRAFQGPCASEQPQGLTQTVQRDLGYMDDSEWQRTGVPSQHVRIECYTMPCLTSGTLRAEATTSS